MLVANRGEIAARILRSVRALGLRALLVAHADERGAPALALADDVRFLSGPTPVAAFLDGAQIIAAARDMGAGAIHPGYGFLAENADFAAAVGTAGLVFIGPPPAVIRLMGDKVRARNFVAARGFPVAPGAIEDDDPAGFADAARALGPPLLIKPSAGGGGCTTSATPGPCAGRRSSSVRRTSGNGANNWPDTSKRLARFAMSGERREASDEVRDAIQLIYSGIVEIKTLVYETSAGVNERTRAGSRTSP